MKKPGTREVVTQTESHLITRKHNRTANLPSALHDIVVKLLLFDLISSTSNAAMSKSKRATENGYGSYTSNFVLDIEDPDEVGEVGAAAVMAGRDEDYGEPYMGEPLANDAWLANYNAERQAEQERND